jgi:hypothetical protein
LDKRRVRSKEFLRPRTRSGETSSSSVFGNFGEGTGNLEAFLLEHLAVIIKGLKLYNNSLFIVFE